MLYWYPCAGGLAWDGKYLWDVSTTSRKICKYDTNGNVLTSFDAPNGYYPFGLTYDGIYLWCSAAPEIFKQEDMKIFKIYPGKPSEGRPSPTPTPMPTLTSTLSPTPTVTPVPTLTPTPTTPSPAATVTKIPTSEEKGVQGFEVILATAGLLAVAYLLRGNETTGAPHNLLQVWSGRGLCKRGLYKNKRM